MNWRTIIIASAITAIVTCAALVTFLLVFAAFAPVALGPILKNPSGKHGLLFLTVTALIFVTPILATAVIIFIKSKENKFVQAATAALAGVKPGTSSVEIHAWRRVRFEAVVQ